jgi:hypothetical protein
LWLRVYFAIHLSAEFDDVDARRQIRACDANQKDISRD